MFVFVSLNVIISKSLQVAANHVILFTAEWYSIVYMDHMLLYC